MSIDILKTIAILDDAQYIRAAERMRRATAGLGADSAGSRLAKMTDGFALAGVAMTALGVKAVGQAAMYQQQEKAFEGLLGSAEKGKALFEQLASFTVHTPFQLEDWTKSTRTLLGWGMAADQIMPALNALGNSEAAMGRTGADMQRAAYELGEMGSGFISMKQVRALMMDGVPAAAALKKELHLTGEELANIGKMHIDGQVGVAAIEKYIQESNLSTGMEQQMNTLNGSITSLKDNWNLFLNRVGSPALQPLTDLVNKSSELLSNFQKLPDETQKAIGTGVLLAGPALLAGAGGLKILGFWKDLTTAKNTARIAAALEDGAEKGKLTTFTSEATALETSAVKWKGLGTAIADIPTLLKAIPGAAAAALRGLGASIEAFGAAGTLGTALAGGSILALPFVEAAIFADKILEQQNAMNDAIQKAAEMPDLAPFIDRIAKDRQLLKLHPNDPWLTKDLQQNLDMLSKMSGHDARMKAIADAATGAGGDGTGDDGTGGDAPPMSDTDLKLDNYATMMKIAELDYKYDKVSRGGKGWTGSGKNRTVFGHAIDGGPGAQAQSDLARYNKFRELSIEQTQREIQGWQGIADKIEKAEGHTKKYFEAEKQLLSYKEKEAQLRDSTLGEKAASKSAMERLATQIISAAGVGEDTVIKMGLNRRLFSEMVNGRMTDHVGGGALRSLAAGRALPQVVQHIHVHIGNKEISTITQRVAADVVRDLVASIRGSLIHTLPGGAL